MNQNLSNPPMGPDWADEAYHDCPAPGEFVVEVDDQGRQIKNTNCHFCGYLCAFRATVDHGKVVDLQPDPTRFPYDPKVLAGCRRWKKNLDVLDSPDRVNHPLKRVGERGSNQWERVSWDEALDDIAARLSALREEHGPGTLCSMIGGPHTSFWPLHRFMNLFGSPNNMGIGPICWNPRVWTDMLTLGWTIEHDAQPGLTKCFMIVGTNPAASDNSLFWQSLREFGKSPDTKLVVVDPIYSQTASVADVWVPLRPGTDCAFFLGLLHVIVEEDLVDHAFVDQWCHGYDEMVRNVQAYDPETVARICGIDAEQVCQVARLFADGPSALVSGRGIDQTGRNVLPTHRAICSLRAITGNVDRPGACTLNMESDFIPEVVLELTSAMTPENRALCLNTPVAPLQCYKGYEYADTLTTKLGRRIPGRYLSSALPDLVLKAMETGDPYKVTALIVEATNPLLTYADTHRMFNALMGLELIVVLDYYMTPTASIADYVLPSAGAIERPVFQCHGGVANMVYGGPMAVNPYYERRADYDVFRELGLRLGQEEHWPWQTFTQACAATLEPTGMDWEDFSVFGLYHQAPPYEKHLIPGPDGKPQGFATSTGKIELASEAIDHLGGERVPTQKPTISLCSEELRAKGAHLELITGARKQPYNASMYLNFSDFRQKCPLPLAEMSPATAAEHGFAEGDVVVLATDQGQARFSLHLRTMRDGLVSADYGWWHPEMTPGAPDFGGIWESNINCLTSCNTANGESMIGTWYYNAIDCVVWKSLEPLSYAKDNLVERKARWVVVNE